MATRITVKTLRVMGPGMSEYASEEKTFMYQMSEVFDKANQEVVNNIDWSLVEDALNDQLPEGFYAELED